MNEQTSKKLNPNGAAIVDTLADRKGEILAFAEIAHLAGIEAKTGYLTAAKKIAADRKMQIEKVKDGVKVKVKTITTYPNSYTAEAEKEITLDGYRLIDAQ